MYTSIELFAGAGGLALGVEKAGFNTLGLIEFDKDAADTLKKNRPNWNVINDDIANISCLDLEKYFSIKISFQVVHLVRHFHMLEKGLGLKMQEEHYFITMHCSLKNCSLKCSCLRMSEDCLHMIMERLIQQCLIFLQELVIPLTNKY